ncbi:hypothetical protein EGJ51_17925 [Pseudomonas fulva]|uniref:hypothetical protein n=1 Tax=Pseudomonas fulva TaxID=47880 RepID=UPI000F7A11F7|nr:hypothetical protein [Pseudomonas fulva]RRW59518.1 hypothetical protein EGJ51_17925 [Pseudomonas fulva]
MGKRAVHYDDYDGGTEAGGDDCDSQLICGTEGEFEQHHFSRVWSLVTCKRCLRIRAKADKRHALDLQARKAAEFDELYGLARANGYTSAAAAILSAGPSKLNHDALPLDRENLRIAAEQAMAFAWPPDIAGGRPDAPSGDFMRMASPRTVLALLEESAALYKAADPKWASKQPGIGMLTAYLRSAQIFEGIDQVEAMLSFAIRAANLASLDDSTPAVRQP